MTRFSLLAGTALSALTISNVVCAGVPAVWVGGGTPGLWTDTANWDGGHIPDQTTYRDIVIEYHMDGGPFFDTAAASASGDTFDTLTLMSGAELAVIRDIAVDHTIVGSAMGNPAQMSILGNSAFEGQILELTSLGSVRVGLGPSAGELKLTAPSTSVGLTVEAGGEVSVAANSTFTFDSTSGPFDAQIRGVITLPTSTSKIRILEDTDFNYATSPGQIQFGNAAAEIFIAGAKTLTNQIDMEGFGQIDGLDVSGLGTLENNGSLVAKNGELVLNPGLIIDGVGNWEASGSAATLVFAESATVSGDFVADNQGTIKIEPSVSLSTTGSLHIDDDSTLLLGSGAGMDVENLTGLINAELIACDAIFVVNGVPPMGFPATMPPELNDEWFLFTGTDVGTPQSCPR